MLEDSRAQDIATLQQENAHLQAEVSRLQEQLQQRHFLFADIANDSDKVLFFTGLHDKDVAAAHH